MQYIDFCSGTNYWKMDRKCVHTLGGSHFTFLGDGMCTLPVNIHGQYTASLTIPLVSDVHVYCILKMFVYKYTMSA